VDVAKASNSKACKIAVSDEQIAFVHDLFESVGSLTTRKMFGGLGIYADGVIFALVMSEGQLRLKGAGNMVETFDAEGWDRWTYTRKDGAASSMPYWTMPERLLDDPEEASAWARRALAAL
jgi:DNA transformation protein